MDLIEVSLKTSINFYPGTLREEVMQNVRTALGTWKYSVPFDRDFAISGDYLDNPIPVNKALASADLVQAIKNKEPRANVREVAFEGDGLTGKLVPIVRILINE